MPQQALTVSAVSEWASCFFLAGVVFNAHGEVFIDTPQGWFPTFFWAQILVSEDKCSKKNIKGVNAFDVFDLA